MLVIIDIQETYEDSIREQKENFKILLAKLHQRVREAQERDEPVVNLTQMQDGFTLPEIKNLIAGCKKCYSICKESYDGSMAVDCLCKRERIEPGEIELAGMFRDVCVLDTWRGLRAKGYHVLPVKREMTLETLDNWTKLESYPDDFLEEDKMFTNEEDNIRCLKELVGEVPGENRIIILEDGTIIMDAECPLDPEALGEVVSDPILCGC